MANFIKQFFCRHSDTVYISQVKNNGKYTIIRKCVKCDKTIIETGSYTSYKCYDNVISRNKRKSPRYTFNGSHGKRNIKEDTRRKKYIRRNFW